LVLTFALIAPGIFWLIWGEDLLAASREAPHEYLIVDGWIGEVPIETASREYTNGGYRYVVATGGYEGSDWSKHRWSDAEIAKRNLLNNGVPAEEIIFAQAPAASIHRTFTTAAACKTELQRSGLTPKSVVVFVRGAHARRSRMVFQKVFGPDVQVGVIGWRNPLDGQQRWWRSSERAEDFLKESVGCLFEWAFNSGR
jgi:uncharacterized SAM-binding protein YcdF (DUF218 family)